MTSWLPQIDLSKCAGCGLCVVACPTQVLGIIVQQAAIVAGHACNYCGACEETCPSSAISLPYQVCLKSAE